MRRKRNGLTYGQMKVLAACYVIFLIAMGSGIIYFMETHHLLGIEAEAKDPIQARGPDLPMQPPSLEQGESQGEGQGAVIATQPPEGETRRGEAMIISQYVYVGDSRYVGMSKYMGINDVFLCQSGVGVNFLSQNESVIKSYDSENTVFIVGLGVNSLGGNAADFARVVNRFAASVRGRVCYTMVGPVDEEKCMASGYTTFNSSIGSWNQRMQNTLSSDVVIIDVNGYLLQSGFDATDGLHYTDRTYKKIYDYIRNTVNGNL